MARWLARRPQPLRGSAPVLTVTFDDVIGSACEAGAEILHRHGALATYYVAGGLTGTLEDDRAVHSVDQLRRLHEQGHEIACHGWSHQRYTGLGAAELRADLARNRAFLAQVTGAAPSNFAYPFGAHDLRTKRLCARHFDTCRILGGGFHRRQADLANLGSWRLYGHGRQAQAWEPALRGLAGGGWAIFNTHGVEPDCGRYGCTPQDLEALLARARELGYLILNMRQALAYWRGAA
ncbi:polysaccharide deacetylase family protein [Orrella sp. JC864]|uniref:polysaccharide deacetylase family protein n=1 Tax=Orrella sp. JC864 TaxID=3120298 RepID=UPI0030085B89